MCVCVCVRLNVCVAVGAGGGVLATQPGAGLQSINSSITNFLH